MKMTSLGESGEKQHLFSSPASLSLYLSFFLSLSPPLPFSLLLTPSVHDDNTKCYFDVGEEGEVGGGLKRFVMLNRNARKMKS